VPFDDRRVEQAPIDREGTLALARRARRFLVKRGDGIVELDRALQPVGESDALALLLHEDGLLRVPVLLVGDVLVRGFTDDLYRRALSPPPPTAS
jgi:arsenate reductase-like glutaredoxin family protein